ncbi:MAG: hypothetical protein ACOYXB_14865 [Bacteroidota bacterium]
MNNVKSFHALIFILLLIIPFALQAQSCDCQSFRDGLFESYDKTFGKSIIERRGKWQIEYSELTKTKVLLKVKWIDDCNYTLKLIRILENPYHMELKKKIILHVQIIETSENMYKHRSSCEKPEFAMEGTFTRTEGPGLFNKPPKKD